VIRDADWLQARHQWPGLKSIVVVESQHEINGKITDETRFSRKLKHAQILLAADAGCSDDEIARTVAVGGSTVYRTERRFVEGDLERTLALRPAHSRLSPIPDTHSEGFSYFVTSIAAPAASGWSDCRVGLAPTGKRRLVTANTR
jgi:hypothetical protein